MNLPRPRFAFAELQFEDVDEYARLFAAQGWSMEIRQLDRGPFRGKLDVMSAGPFRISHVRSNRRLEIDGHLPQNLVSLGVPLRNAGGVSWMRQPLSSRTIQHYGEGSEFEAVTPPDFETVMVGIEPEEARHHEAELGLLLGSETRRLSCADVPCEWLGRRLLELAGTIRRGAQCASASDDAVYGITSTLLASVAGGIRSEDRSQGWVRDQAIRKAEEYLRDNKEEVVTVSDLVRHCHVSKRTLERAFRDRFGMGPKAYLMAVRLNGVRSELRESAPAETRVADVANRWGFWHMGQFARDYRRMFGKLPSETLQGARGSTSSP